jgi:prepilin-type N-terminal cleavage/methylation domain-containing protein
MKTNFRKSGLNKGFSLAEMIAALVIGSMILIAVLSVYNRAESATSSVNRLFDNYQTPREALQLIAEDLDRIITDNQDTTIRFQNKTELNGYHSARLEIIKTIFNKDNEATIFEKIVWQTAADPYSDANGLVLYRSHSGIALEDKLLDESKEQWQRDVFVPVCEGITLFAVQTGTGQKLADNTPVIQDIWTSGALPTNVIVTISFTEPVEVLRGVWEIPENKKITRTIAIDRTRKIAFVVEKEIAVTVEEEPNRPSSEEPNEADKDKILKETGDVKIPEEI